MRKTLLLLLAPFFFVSTAFILMGGCYKQRPKTCGYYTKGELTLWNYADSTPKPASISGVLAKAFYMVLVLSDTGYLCCGRQIQLPINTAYALTRPSNHHFIGIDSFIITSNREFDPSHPAGSRLNDLFSQPKPDANFHDISYTNERYYLLHSPSDTGTHTFTMYLITADSARNFYVTAAPVKLII